MFGSIGKMASNAAVKLEQSNAAGNISNAGSLHSRKVTPSNPRSPMSYHTALAGVWVSTSLVILASEATLAQNAAKAGKTILASRIPQGSALLSGVTGGFGLGVYVGQGNTPNPPTGASDQPPGFLQTYVKLPETNSPQKT